MGDIIKGRPLDAESRRALQLDTLAATLPMDRRDRLAQLLTDDDVETLKHLARAGLGENSLRALLEGLDGRRIAAVASNGSLGAEVCRAPPVGSGTARERSPARNACGGCRQGYARKACCAATVRAHRAP